MDALRDLAHICRFWRISPHNTIPRFPLPNRLVDLLTFYYGDYTIKTTTNIFIKPLCTVTPIYWCRCVIPEILLAWEKAKPAKNA
jgi:hypothetical protein